MSPALFNAESEFFTLGFSGSLPMIRSCHGVDSYKLNLGAAFFYDKQPTLNDQVKQRSDIASFNVAYNFYNFKKHKLSIGGQVNFINRKLGIDGFTDFQYIDPDGFKASNPNGEDDLNFNDDVSNYLTYNFGVYYQTQKLQLGLAANNLNLFKEKITRKLAHNFTFTGGYLLLDKLEKKWEVTLRTIFWKISSNNFYQINPGLRYNFPLNNFVENINIGSQLDLFFQKNLTWSGINTYIETTHNSEKIKFIPYINVNFLNFNKNNEVNFGTGVGKVEVGIRLSFYDNEHEMPKGPTSQDPKDFVSITSKDKRLKKNEKRKLEKDVISKIAILLETDSLNINDFDLRIIPPVNASKRKNQQLECFLVKNILKLKIDKALLAYVYEKLIHIAEQAINKDENNYIFELRVN